MVNKITIYPSIQVVMVDSNVADKKHTDSSPFSTPKRANLYKYISRNEISRLIQKFETYHDQLQNLCSPFCFLATFVYTIMLEFNFIPVENPTELTKLPKTWIKNKTSDYMCTFELSGYNGCISQLVISNVANNVMAINLLCVKSSNIYQTALIINDYCLIKSDLTTADKIKNVPHIFERLRDNVIVPGRSDLLTSAGYISGSLVGLSPELLMKIILYLNPIDLVHLTSTCRKLRTFIRDDNIWRKFYFMQFRENYNQMKNLDFIDWFDEYKKCYMKSKSTPKPNIEHRGNLMICAPNIEFY